MKCLIDKVLESAGNKKRKVEVIKRYIRLKYRINLDTEVLENRMKLSKQKIVMA